MKLLFYRYGSICEPFLLSAFAEFGIEVTEIDYEITNKSLSPGECVRLVSQVLLEGSYNLVFSINFFPSLSDACNIFRIPYVGWAVDSPVMELYSEAIKNPCNYIFLFDRCLYNDVSPLNPGHIFYLPLATDTVHMQTALNKNKNPNAYTSDLSFVGSLYTEKCAYDKLKPSPYLSGFLNGLMEAQLKIYGYYFVDDVLTDDVVREFKSCMPGFYSPLDAPYLSDRTIVSQLYIGNKISALERVRLMKLLASQFPTDIYTLSDTSEISGIHNCGSAKTLTEMPCIFHNSTINLNITSKSIRSGIPLRIWDVLGCGGFLISNFQAEIPEYFTPGEDIEVYESPQDLLEKCRYYLEHPKRAKEIGENGLENIRKNHTYLHRIETILQIVFENK